MIMNEFLNKTIKAAKQSALQIYDDDFSNLSLRISWEDEQEKKQKPQNNRNSRGVVFERSSETEANKKPQKVSSTLQTLRQYAAEQSSTEIKEIENWSSSSVPAVESTNVASKKKVSATKRIYSRKDIRKKNLKEGDGNKIIEDDNSSSKKSEAFTERANPSKMPVNQQSEGAARSESNKKVSQNVKESQNDIDARLNQLESLVQLMLSADDFSYSSHPLFQKLLYKGVPKRMIIKWFDTLCEQGIDPNNQQQLFGSKLGLIIQNHVSSAQSERMNHIMLFAGRSGSGKTSLITRLSQHPGFLTNKKLAIAAIYPKEKNYYYSILPEFCRDNNLPYYRIDTETTFEQLYDEWTKFDHVLIDTPSLETDETNLLKTVSKLEFPYRDLSEIDIHYLVNTAVGSNAFNDPLASEIGANHIVLTHLDKSKKWGQSTQLIAQTNYSIRFISGGEAMPESLLPFNAKLFTEKLLR